jgi:hypothetical protein
MKTMKRRSPLSLSRRQLLSSLGLGVAASPLLPLLNATGQESTRPTRLLLLFTPDGAAALDWGTALDWTPQGSETDFTLHPMHQPFAAHQSKVIIPHGLTMSANGAGEAHAFGMAGIWTGATLNGPSGDADFDGGNGNRTGWGSGASIDQIVAGASGSGTPYSVAPDDPSQETAYRTVELGVQSGDPTSVNRNIYAGENSPIHPETNPRAAFDRLFANVVPSDEQSDEPMEDPAVTAARAEQQMIVDLLQDDLDRLRQRVGTQEYQKIDAHLEGLLALEQRLNTTVVNTTPTVGCTIPDRPPDGGGWGDDFQAEIPNMIDVVTHALACDVTRVASLQISHGFSNITHTWLGHDTAHHTMSHDETDRRAELEAIDTWYAEHFNYLLDKLDSVDEGDGTLLDNTLVVWGRELGTTAHRMENVPLVLAGGGAFGVNPGRFLDYSEEAHAKLLVSIAQKMGLDINSVGNIDPDSGPLSGL